MLFFAQHMREMLTQGSFESFRVTTLDLLSRLRELVSVLQEVDAGHVPIAAAEPVLAEVVQSLRDDPVVSQRLSHEIQVFCDYAQKTDVKRWDVPYLIGYCVFFQRRIGAGYGEELEQRILACYSNGSRRDDLRAATATYCSYLINAGYNKRYLLDLIVKRFFTDTICKVEARSLQRFFQLLTKADKAFKVWIGAPATTANFILRAGLPDIQVIVESTLPSDVRNAINAHKAPSKGRRYLTVQVNAKDQYAAATTVFQSLGSIESFVILGRQSLDLERDDFAYVRTPRSSSGYIIQSKPFVLQGISRASSGVDASTIRAQARRTLSEFDQPSTERILSAVNTAALARSSPNPENHLISFWSAIEVLLSNPPSGMPRILHYVELLAPCICLRYPRRYIVAVYDGIMRSYRKQFRPLIASLGVEATMDEYTRFTHICFDPAFKAEQNAMLEMLSGNPLALHRLWKLSTNFLTAKMYNQSVLSHEQRVRWQLHRIYRTRNHLVHAGSVPVFLEPLVMNMLEYFRTTIGPVISKGAREPGLANIDQIITEMGISYDVLRNRASSVQSAAFDPADYGLFYR